MTQFQYDALVSFLYNCGPGKITGEDSQLAKYFNEGYSDWAINYMTTFEYDNYGQKLDILTARRREEAELFYNGDYVWDAQ